MASKDQVKSLRRKRGELKTRLTRHRNYLDKMEGSVDPTLLRIRLADLENHFKNLPIIHDELQDLAGDKEEEDANNLELEAIEEDYYKIVADYNKLITAATPLSREDSAHVQVAVPNRQATVPIVKLPELSIPSFDGSIENWLSFKGKFVSRIHDNQQLAGIDKLQFLESALTGRAKRAIESLETTEQNYEEAWNILLSKYDNSRKAILRHLSILYEIPRLQKSTPKALDDLTDTFQQHLRALKTLGEPVEQWNSMIIFLLLSKVNDNTRFQWETTLADNKMPSYESLIKFLEKRGNCTDTSTDKADQEHSSRVRRSPRNHQTTTDNKQSRPQALVTSTPKNKFPLCPICKDQHSIYKCQSFRKMSINDRKKAVANASLCNLCLRAKHGADGCKGDTCHLCNGNHNTYLHPINKENLPGNSQENSGSIALLSPKEGSA